MDLDELDEMYAAYDKYAQDKGKDKQPPKEKKQNNNNSGIMRELNQSPQCCTCEKMKELNDKIEKGVLITEDYVKGICWHCKTTGKELKTNLGYRLYKDNLIERQCRRRIEAQQDVIATQQEMLEQQQEALESRDKEIERLKGIAKKYKAAYLKGKEKEQEQKEQEQREQEQKWRGKGKKATATKRYGKIITNMYCKDNIPAYKISASIGVCDRTVRKVIKALGLKRGVLPDTED